MTDIPYDRDSPRTALFHTYLEQRAAQSPDASAYSYEPVGVEAADAETGTWRELNAASGLVAEALDAEGVEKGDFVVTLLPQSPQYLAAYAAAAKLGAVLVPLDFRSEAREIADVLERTEPSAFLGFDRYRGDGYRETLEGIDAFDDVPNVWWLDEDDPTDEASEDASEYRWSVVAPDGTDLPDDEATGHLDPDAPLLVVFTSGTTGRPKGALLSHRNAVFQGTAIADTWEVDEDDTSLAHLPPSHVGGSTELLATAVVAGARIVFLDAVEPNTALERIDEQDVTLVGNVPALWEMFFAFSNYRDRMSSVRLAIVAGQAPSEDTLEKMSEVGTATTGWGLTETGGFVTLTDLDDGMDVLTETVGRPYPGFEVRAVGEDGTALDEGDVGELAVRGNGVMVGYMDTETEESPNGDGWIRTGDMGFVGDDGRVRLRGRAHEMYISGGYNVYPAEVEDVLTDHPDVRLALVIGVEDERWGETGHAFVVPEAGAELAAEEVERYCEENLADYKRPSEYTVEASLPKTILGKIDRQRIIEEYGLEIV
ncbi:MAG: class I adenylate-forming enzyme family protein [Halobacteriales archaeon]|nr:class I adenylate-forming enzyme family protein [Halobacteriales archaeon]